MLELLHKKAVLRQLYIRVAGPALHRPKLLPSPHFCPGGTFTYCLTMEFAVETDVSKLTTLHAITPKRSGQNSPSFTRC